MHTKLTTNRTATRARVRRAQAKKYGFHLRELHLIDIENELGTGRPSEHDVIRFREFYIERNNVPADAHIVIAASSSASLLAATYGWPGARTECIRGRDGADLALIDVALEENVAERFGRVVIASGDHIFSDVATRLQQLGVHVTVFARAVLLSNKLRDVCPDVRVFSARDFVLAA